MGDDLEGEGTVLYVAFAFSDGSRDAYAPYFSKVLIPGGFYELDDEEWRQRGEDFSSPVTI